MASSNFVRFCRSFRKDCVKKFGCDHFPCVALLVRKLLDSKLKVFRVKRRFSPRIPSEGSSLSRTFLHPWSSPQQFIVETALTLTGTALLMTPLFFQEHAPSLRIHAALLDNKVFAFIRRINCHSRCCSLERTEFPPACADLLRMLEVAFDETGCVWLSSTNESCLPAESCRTRANSDPHDRI